MSLIVEVEQGKLQGIENKSVLNGETYYSFKGIPYAKPPLNDLRFKPPEPCEKWQGIYDATYERDICIQNDLLSNQQTIGSEDCLYLNIDTPQAPCEIQVPKAVMVFIHGGGFFIGSGSEEKHSGDYLITRDIVLVRINYRLHVLGFLNLGLEECRGNAGLKDQAMALKWVKNNIAKFGGDPNNVTIFGESAGASSVQFQILSPLTKGLFHKAILQSGSSLTPWALTYNYKEIANQFGEKLGFKGGSSEDLLQFLKAQPAKDLCKQATVIHEHLKENYPGRCTTIPFSPSVEEIKEGVFLPDFPKKLLEKVEPLPMIYGVNNKEGMLISGALSRNLINFIREDFSLVLKYNFKMQPAKLSEISPKVKQYFFGDKEVSEETVDQLFDLYSNLFFYEMYEPIEFVTKSSVAPFLYEFSYDGNLNALKKIFLMMSNVKQKIPGAAHGDELGYLFYPRMNPQPPKFSDDDLSMIQNITTFWTNFAKTGAPSDELTWTASTSNQPRYLEMDRNLQMKEGTLYGERLQFLKDLIGPSAKPYDIF